MKRLLSLLNCSLQNFLFSTSIADRLLHSILRHSLFSSINSTLSCPLLLLLLMILSSLATLTFMLTILTMPLLSNSFPCFHLSTCRNMFLFLHTTSITHSISSSHPQTQPSIHLSPLTRCLHLITFLCLPNLTSRLCLLLHLKFALFVAIA